MLVVTDQDPVRVGRQRGLTGAGQPEEKRHVTVVPDVARAVHRHDSLFRQQEVHHREDRFLDLAGILCPADQNVPGLEVDDDECARPQSKLGRLSLEIRSMQHGEFRLPGGSRRLRRTDEHCFRKKRVPCRWSHDADWQSVRRIGAGIKILHKAVALPEVTEQCLAQAIGVRLRDGLVDIVPIDRAVGRRLIDDIAILRRAPGVRAGGNDQ